MSQFQFTSNTHLQTIGEYWNSRERLNSDPDLLRIVQALAWSSSIGQIETVKALVTNILNRVTDYRDAQVIALLAINRANEKEHWEIVTYLCQGFGLKVPAETKIHGCQVIVAANEQNQPALTNLLCQRFGIKSPFEANLRLYAHRIMKLVQSQGHTNVIDGICHCLKIPAEQATQLKVQAEKIMDLAKSQGYTDVTDYVCDHFNQLSQEESRLVLIAHQVIKYASTHSPPEVEQFTLTKMTET